MAARTSSPDPAGHLTQPSVAFDAQLAAMAPPRDAVFALEELVALGLGGAAVRARCAAGRLHRIHRAVYSLVPREMLTVRGRYRAATLACTGRRHVAALSHRSVGDFHGLASAIDAPSR